MLLDAHTLIWAVDDPSKLSARAAAELRDMGNGLLLGAGTMWEMSIKVGLIIDDYSRAVAGYFLTLSAPSAIRTALALRQAIWRKTQAG